MATASDKEIKGAWVIHHGRKLVLDVNGPAEFPAINEAAKAATLLTKLAKQTKQPSPRLKRGQSPSPPGSTLGWS